MPGASEAELYELGRCIAAHPASLPDLPPDELRHVIRGLWEASGFIGRNNGGYPVVSLVASQPVAEAAAGAIQSVTGRRSPPRPLRSGGWWVGVSGRWCAPWLEFLYAPPATGAPLKRAQACALIESLRALHDPERSPHCP